MTPAGFPHSEILGSQLGWQLPEAYRSLPRPSSAPGAQASTVCPQHLGHTTTYTHSTPPPPPLLSNRRNQRRARGHKRSKMLASTVQFSTTNQPPPTPTPPAQRPTPPTGRASRGMRSRRPWRHPEDPPGVKEAVRSLRTQQRAYDRPPRPAPAFPTPRITPDGRTDGPRQRPAELVSVPPSSTTPGTSGHRK